MDLHDLGRACLSRRRTYTRLGGSLALPETAAELAYTVLVKRHGPMVFRACQFLYDPHEAEDAF